jgi:hypothetical protein
VACAKCHDPKTAWGKKPPFARCEDCHHDAHAGKALLGGKAAACASCHDVSGFTKSTMLVSAHDQTGYPLEGAHVRAACGSCHTRAPAGAGSVAALGSSRVRLQMPFAACTDCHGDPHRRSFASAGTSAAQAVSPKGAPRGAAAKPGRRRETASSRVGSACLACHDMSRFVPARYDAKAHGASAYPLLGAHLATPCSACHGELIARPPAHSTVAADSAGLRVLRFVDTRRKCDQCHTNPHGQQFAGRAGGEACETCHDLAAFAPASRFDHGQGSGFHLEGEHAKTPCSGCHKPAKDPDNVTRTRWKPVPRACEACHGTKH